MTYNVYYIKGSKGTHGKILFEWWTFGASFKSSNVHRAGLGQMATL